MIPFPLGFWGTHTPTYTDRDYLLVSMMKRGSTGATSAWNHADPTTTPTHWTWNHSFEHPNAIDVYDTTNAGYGEIAGGNQGPIYVNDFKLNQQYNILGWNKTWDTCNARIRVGILDSSDNWIWGFCVQRSFSYASRLYYSTDGSTWTNTWGTYSGSSPAVIGYISFDSSNVYFTHDPGTGVDNAGYQNSTSYSVDLSSAAKLKIFDCYVYSGYSGPLAIAYCHMSRRVVAGNNWITKGLVGPP